MATDKYGDSLRNMESPAVWAAEVTPDDDADLEFVARALWVGTGGALKVTTAKGSTVTFNVPGGGVLPVQVSRVFATGTDASGIVALW